MLRDSTKEAKRWFTKKVKKTDYTYVSTNRTGGIVNH